MLYQLINKQTSAPVATLELASNEQPVYFDPGPYAKQLKDVERCAYNRDPQNALEYFQDIGERLGLHFSMLSY